MTNRTPGPWVGFSDQGKCIAIMPAGRDGDVCTFKQPPNDADARLMIAAPQLADALRMLDTLLDFSDTLSDNVWTFEDLTAIQAAFDRAKSALDQITGDDVSRSPERNDG